jgi:transposase
VKQTTREVEYTTEPSLYLAFELGKAKWKLGLSTGLGQNPRLRTIDAGDLSALEEEIGQAKRRFHLPESAAVRSCYEAGRDGFWLHRYLVQKQVQSLVVDSSSIEVNRRARRAKTDRLDATKLLTMLIRYHSGEEKVWSVVQVPTVEAEDMRHLHRQLSNLQIARTRHISRIEGLLASQGVSIPIHADFLETLPSIRLWDGSSLPPGVRARIEREHAALQYVRQQIRELVAEREKLIETSDEPSIRQVRQLMKLVALGPNSAWLFVMEFFAWR